MSEPFDPWVQSVESRLSQMDAELTQNVARTNEAHHAVVALTSELHNAIAAVTKEVGRMTEAFRDGKNALYGVAAIILASAVLVILVGHP